jgi:chromosome segregation ATPase
VRTKPGGAQGGQRPGGGGGGAGYSAAELAALQAAIQKLAQATTPLGNSLDYVPEDAQDMAAELQAWRGEYARRRDALEREQAATEAALAPLHRAAAEAGERCREAARRIAALKNAVSKNDARIGELLRLVVRK